jgi:hypothetical protein
MVAGLSRVFRERERQRVQKAQKAPFPVQLLLLHTFARAWAPTPSPPGPSQVTPQKILRPDQLLSFGATREPPLSTQTRPDPTAWIISNRSLISFLQARKLFAGNFRLVLLSAFRRGGGGGSDYPHVKVARTNTATAGESRQLLH